MVDKKFKDFDAAASESAAEIIEFKIAEIELLWCQIEHDDFENHKN